MLPTFDIPPIGPRQAKVWGTTQLVFARNGTEAHRITFEKGGYCSKHRHVAKWNRFLVLSGSLRVTIFQPDGNLDETMIEQGGITDVPPGVWHRFETVQPGSALEFYWTVLDPQDIEREEEGGK